MKSSCRLRYRILTILVIGVALALPYLGISIATVVQGQIEQLDSPPQLSLLLDGTVTYEEARAFGNS